jgi:hypothetical protein
MIEEPENKEVIDPEIPAVEATAEVPAEEAAPVPTSRDKFYGKIKSSYPEEQFEGDDAIYEKATAHLEDLEGFKSKGMEVNKMLSTVLRGEPELDGIVKAVLKGKPVRAAIANYFSPEDLIPQDGEEDFEAYAASANERSQRVSDRDKFEREVEDNLVESEATLRAFAEEAGLDETQSLELIDVVSEIMGDLYKGKLPKGLLSHVQNSRTKDKAIEQAASDGELKGKNAKIEAVMAGDKKAGDNIPTFKGGAAEEVKEQAPKKISRLDALVERENRKRNF